MNEFSEKYKSLGDFELLRILEEKEKYQLAAVEAAKNEIKARNLSEKRIAEIQQQLRSETRRKQENEVRKKEAIEKQKKKFSSFLKNLNPNRDGLEKSEKIIRILTLIFGAIAIYGLYNNIDFLSYSIMWKTSNWDWTTFMFFLPLLVLLAGVYLFYRRKKIGWMLLLYYVGSTLVVNLLMLIDAIRMKDVYFPIFEDMVPGIPVIGLTLLFYLACLFALCRKDVLQKFRVTSASIIVVVVLIMGLFIFEWVL